MYTQYINIPNKHKFVFNAGSMLGQRRRWWAKIKPATGQRSVFTHEWDMLQIS